MPQERIWTDPTLPAVKELPEPTRRRILKLLATLALHQLERRRRKTRRGGPRD